MNNTTDLIEEIELKDLEQRIEFGCCGDGNPGGGGGTGPGGDNCREFPERCLPE